MDTLSFRIGNTIIFEPPPNVPNESSAMSNIINWALNLIMVAGVILALGFLIYSGILWTTSGGDKKQLETAKNSLTYSIIGLIVIAFAFVIVNIIGQILGVNSLANLGRP